MKYCLIIPSILAILTPEISDAQNLIINPSFEEYTQCPYALGQTDFCTNWHSSLGSCDYFNACKFDFGVGVPTNLLGTQNAFEGSGYCGLITYDNVDPNYREVLTAELSFPLDIGATYYFSMRFCRAGEGASTSLSSNNLGIKLSEESSPSDIDNTALIYSNQLVVDTALWHILSGSFVATQEYTYIHIGNFFDDVNTLTMIDGIGNPRWAYYFIDDVRLSTDSAEMHVHVGPVSSVPSSNAIIVDGSRTVFLSFLAQSTQAYLYTPSGSLCEHYASPIDGNVNFSSFVTGLYFMKYFKMDGSFETVFILIE